MSKRILKKRQSYRETRMSQKEEMATCKTEEKLLRLPVDIRASFLSMVARIQHQQSSQMSGFLHQTRREFRQLQHDTKDTFQELNGMLPNVSNKDQLNAALPSVTTQDDDVFDTAMYSRSPTPMLPPIMHKPSTSSPSTPKESTNDEIYEAMLKEIEEEADAIPENSKSRPVSSKSIQRPGSSQSEAFMVQIEDEVAAGLLDTQPKRQSTSRPESRTSRPGTSNSASRSGSARRSSTPGNSKSSSRPGSNGSCMLPDIRPESKCSIRSSPRITSCTKSKHTDSLPKVGTDPNVSLQQSVTDLLKV